MASKISTAACLLLLTAGLALPALAAPSQSANPTTQTVQPKQTATMKTVHKVAHTRHRKVAYYGKNFLVPPPPPYAPNMLPELQYGRYSQQPQTSVSAENHPYSKYINYTRSGYEQPKPVQPNKYVTYWNNKT